jgi:hypothetical protein
MWVESMLKLRLVDLLTPYLRWKDLKRAEFLERDPEQWSSWLNLVRIFLYATHFNNTSWKIILEVIGAREN